MDITPVLAGDRQLVRSYGVGQFTINETVFHGPILLTPSHCESWNVTSLDTVDPPSLASLKGFCEILLIGTGPTQQFLSPSRRRALQEYLNVILEPMDSGAACRTFNVLMAEDRAVAAALLPL